MKALIFRKFLTAALLGALSIFLLSVGHAQPDAGPPLEVAGWPGHGDAAEPDVAALVSAVLGSFASRNWRNFAAAFVLLAVWATRKWGAKVWPVLETRKASVYLVLGTAIISTLATAILRGAALDVDLVADAVLIGLGAIGGWKAGKDLKHGEARAAVDTSVKIGPAL